MSPLITTVGQGVGGLGGTPPRSGMVRLTASTGARLTLIVMGDPDRSGSVGGWQVSERAVGQETSWWRGTPSGTYSAPCALDLDEVGGPSIERRLEVLYGMGQPGEDDEPPIIRLSGDAPMCKTQDWKIDDIRLTGRLFRDDDPQALRRQELTLELSTIRVAEGVERVRIRATRENGKRRQRTIAARKGDTLRSIAVRQLGSSSEWQNIRVWNRRLRKIDPDSPLRPGTRIVLK